MMKKIWVILGLFLVFLVVPQANAVTSPPAPKAPQIAENRPEPPQVSGDFLVKEFPGLHVRVITHPAKPPKPTKPGVSPTPVATASDSLVCGLADPDSASSVGEAGWHIVPGNITYRLNPSSVPLSVGGSNLDFIVLNGFNQYNQATSGKVSFTKGSNTSVSRSRYDGQNVISWGRLSNGVLGTTYVWYYPSTGNLVEVDTIMNNRYKWSLSNDLSCADNKSFDAKDIMTHELGHWMGLDDMYDLVNFGDATMYGYGAIGEVKKNTLTTGDKLGISAIYSAL